MYFSNWSIALSFYSTNYFIVHLQIFQRQFYRCHKNFNRKSSLYFLRFFFSNESPTRLQCDNAFDWAIKMVFHFLRGPKQLATAILSARQKVIQLSSVRAWSSGSIRIPGVSFRGDFLLSFFAFNNNDKDRKKRNATLCVIEQWLLFADLWPPAASKITSKGYLFYCGASDAIWRDRCGFNRCNIAQNSSHDS